MMKASVGDRIMIVPNRMDVPARDGRILEVRSGDGSPPYLVEWSDNGHKGLVFPGMDAQIQHFEGSAPAHTATRPDDPGTVRTWKIDLHLYEVGEETTAHAVLVGDVPAIETTGSARRSPTVTDVPRIGDEVAAARALHRLADRMLASAKGDIAAAQGKSVLVHR